MLRACSQSRVGFGPPLHAAPLRSPRLLEAFHSASRYALWLVLAISFTHHHEHCTTRYHSPLITSHSIHDSTPSITTPTRSVRVRLGDGLANTSRMACSAQACALHSLCAQLSTKSLKPVDVGRVHTAHDDASACVWSPTKVCPRPVQLRAAVTRGHLGVLRWAPRVTRGIGSRLQLVSGRKKRLDIREWLAELRLALSIPVVRSRRRNCSSPSTLGARTLLTTTLLLASGRPQRCARLCNSVQL